MYSVKVTTECIEYTGKGGLRIESCFAFVTRYFVIAGQSALLNLSRELANSEEKVSRYSLPRLNVIILRRGNIVELTYFGGGREEKYITQYNK